MSEWVPCQKQRVLTLCAVIGIVVIRRCVPAREIRSEVDVTLSQVRCALRQDVVWLLLSVVDQPSPNLAHFLLGFDVRKPTARMTLQDPGKWYWYSRCCTDLEVCCISIFCYPYECVNIVLCLCCLRCNSHLTDVIPRWLSKLIGKVKSTVLHKRA